MASPPRLISHLSFLIVPYSSSPISHPSHLASLIPHLRSPIPSSFISHVPSCISHLPHLLPPISHLSLRNPSSLIHRPISLISHISSLILPHPSSLISPPSLEAWRSGSLVQLRPCGRGSRQSFLTRLRRRRHPQQEHRPVGPTSTQPPAPSPKPTTFRVAGARAPLRHASNLCGPFTLCKSAACCVPAPP